MPLYHLQTVNEMSEEVQQYTSGPYREHLLKYMYSLFTATNNDYVLSYMMDSY